MMVGNNVYEVCRSRVDGIGPARGFALRADVTWRCSTADVGRVSSIIAVSFFARIR